MKIQDVVTFLKSNYYIIELGGNIIVTNKFKRAFKSNLPIEIGGALPIAISKPTQIALPVKVPIPADSKTLYKEFIKQAEVPTYLPLGNGGKYAANRYSKDAEKVFAQILKDGAINKKGLLIATKLYYKQHNVARNTISNYFILGVWESVYEDFMEQVEGGDIENYIQKTLKEGNGESTYEEGI